MAIKDADANEVAGTDWLTVTAVVEQLLVGATVGLSVGFCCADRETIEKRMANKIVFSVAILCSGEILRIVSRVS